jgi:hypothetical protein
MTGGGFAVVDRGSLTAAAMDMSRAMASRFLAELSWLARLLPDYPQAHLTSAGELALVRCRRRRLGEDMRSVLDPDAAPHGLIRITCGTPSQAHWPPSPTSCSTSRHLVDMLLQDRAVDRSRASTPSASPASRRQPDRAQADRAACSAPLRPTCNARARPARPRT